MATPYTTIATLRRSTILKDKVSVAVSIAAQAILNESTTTPNHKARLRWAQTASISPEQLAEQMLWAVLGNASIQASGDESPDQDVQFVVNSLIDVFAS